MHSSPNPSATILMISAQWTLTGLGLFCLVGATVATALTPEA
ncbi:hypothetical protein [Comamonas testosteroni]